jgi:hypothetical protein
MVTFSAINAVLAVLAATALYATYAGAPDAKWSVYCAAAICIVIAVHQSINFAFALDLLLRRRRNRAGWKQPAALQAPPDTLDFKQANTAPAVIVPSVTEGTTELMSGETASDPSGLNG